MATEAKHTKGPWALRKVRAPRAIGHFVWSPETAQGSSFCIADVSALNIYESGTSEANARLIAAAPDLLEAVQYCRERITAMPAHDAVEHDAFVSIQMRCASALSKAGASQ